MSNPNEPSNSPVTDVTNPENVRERRNAVFSAGPQPAGRPSVPGPSPSDILLEIPHEMVPLPSMGKVYPTGSPLANRETVEITAMTTRQEDILTSRALIKKGVVITHLLQSCIVDKSINVLDMLSGDRNAIMVAVRITGYGVDYDAEIQCGNRDCQVKKERTFNLGDLTIKRLTIDPVVPNSNLFQFRLPQSGYVVGFKFLTGGEEEDIVATQERLKKQGVLSDNLVTSRLLYAIHQVNSVTDRAAIQKFVRNMPARDSIALRNYIDMHEPGIAMKQFSTCDACGHEEEVSIPFGVGFFWPKS